MNRYDLIGIYGVSFDCEEKIDSVWVHKSRLMSMGRKMKILVMPELVD
jgi:hypothetical protein